MFLPLEAVVRLLMRTLVPQVVDEVGQVHSSLGGWGSYIAGLDGFAIGAQPDLGNDDRGSRPSNLLRRRIRDAEAALVFLSQDDRIN